MEWEGEWESGGSGSIGVRGWVEGWMSGMKCMDINGFLGDDDVLMVLILHNSLTHRFHLRSLHCKPSSPFFASGLRANGIINSIADFSGISMG